MFSPDAVHPYPQTGHQIYREAVVRSMEKIRKAGQPKPHSLPAPFRADNWEMSKMVPLDQVVKPRFDSFCTYHRLGTLSIAEGLPNTVHQVVLTVHPDQPDKAKILSQRNEKMDDPKRYDGAVWYTGAILLVGELVE